MAASKPARKPGKPGKPAGKEPKPILERDLLTGPRVVRALNSMKVDLAVFVKAYEEADDRTISVEDAAMVAYRAYQKSGDLEAFKKATETTGATYASLLGRCMRVEIEERRKGA